MEEIYVASQMASTVQKANGISGQIFVLDHEMFLKIVGVDDDKEVW